MQFIVMDTVQQLKEEITTQAEKDNKNVGQSETGETE
jgi:hypothetical protein